MASSRRALSPEELEAALACQRDNGELREEDLIRAAKSEKSPLHGRFTWDDGVAAAEYRLLEARTVIRLVTITLVVHEQEVTTVGFVSVPPSDPSAASGKGDHTYRSPVKISLNDFRAVMRGEAARNIGNLQRWLSLVLAREDPEIRFLVNPLRGMVSKLKKLEEQLT